MSGRRILLAVCLALAAAGAGEARAQASLDPRGETLEERIVVGSDIDEVAITATFSGEEVFVYGAVQRNRFLLAEDQTPEIAIVVEGPSSPLVVRRKGRLFGLWVNVESFRIAEAPSFYAVASTRPLDEILLPEEDAAYRISLDKAVLIAGSVFSAQDPEAFRQAALRLRRKGGFYLEDGRGVALKGGTLYQARLKLPASIVAGDYMVRVYLIRGGRVRDSQAIELPVFKQGLERTLGRAAQETPLLYGLGALLMAGFAGWAASTLFRRLGR